MIVYFENNKGGYLLNLSHLMEFTYNAEDDFYQIRMIEQYRRVIDRHHAEYDQAAALYAWYKNAATRAADQVLKPTPEGGTPTPKIHRLH